MRTEIIEITLRYGCSPVNSLHIFRTPFLENTSGWCSWKTLKKRLFSVLWRFYLNFVDVWTSKITNLLHKDVSYVLSAYFGLCFWKLRSLIQYSVNCYLMIKFLFWSFITLYFCQQYGTKFVDRLWPSIFIHLLIYV